MVIGRLHNNHPLSMSRPSLYDYSLMLEVGSDMMADLDLVTSFSSEYEDDSMPDGARCG
jgi:hypothetical protein